MIDDDNVREFGVFLGEIARKFRVFEEEEDDEENSEDEKNEREIEVEVAIVEASKRK